MSPKATLDWTALQRALVFTKLVYRKPAIEAVATRLTGRSDRPAAGTAETTGVALAVAAPARRAGDPRAPLAPVARVAVPRTNVVRLEIGGGTAAAAATPDADFSHRHVDAFGTTDERLLPWSCD